MKEQLISFETAKLAKEKGFELPYPTACYTEEAELYISENLLSERIIGKPKPKNIYIAPTQSLLQKWLREEHNIHILVAATGFTNGAGSIPNRYDVMYFKDICKSTFDSIHDTYEEALEEGLKQALQLITV